MLTLPSTGPYEILYELVLHSNSVVSATCEHCRARKPVPPLLFKALREVLQEHPALAIRADC